jgi:DNA helicase II / ATP-dependent DNA helicase PcrA
MSEATARVWSPQQQAVFAFVEDETARHGVVEALAGTGKTSTIVQALTYTYSDDKTLMVAFNKSIATELQTRVPRGVEVCTLHSFGLRAITRAMGKRNVDNYATHNRLANMMGRAQSAKEARNVVAKLVGLAKGCLVFMPSELDELADTYGIDFPRGWDRGKLVAIASRVLREECEADTGPITFDDMIWLPVVRDLAIPTYAWVFVDETQDLNAAQLEIVVRAAGDKGRIVAVGDRHQAIYGFRGADREAIPRMIRRLNAQVMPLTCTYRCPVGVVREARELVPTLDHAPAAAEGVVREATEETLFDQARPGDFVISRLNAPLISLCFRWLAAGRRASIKGRDIGAGLIAWVRGTNATTIEQLYACLRSWHAAEVRRLEAAERPTEAVDDKAACLEALITGCTDEQAVSPNAMQCATGIDRVILKIEALFGEGDGTRGEILLTSTHRAKGLEADRVWVLRDTYLRRDNEEEKNLLYVAITRSRNELIYVYEKVQAEAEAAE